MSWRNSACCTSGWATSVTASRRQCHSRHRQPRQAQAELKAAAPKRGGAGHDDETMVLELPAGGTGGETDAQESGVVNPLSPTQWRIPAPPAVRPVSTAPRRSRHRRVPGFARIILIALTGLAVLASAIALGIGTSGEPARPAGGRHAGVPRAAPSVATPRWAADQAFGAALYFLDHYELRSGRVARWDQGGDTVSEGEAYAMLLSVAAGDRRRFDAAWDWTRIHLLQPDGLMAWHWANGAITSSEPAADADVDAAYALELAATRFHEQSDLAAAAAMAAAIAGNETVGAPSGPVLVAGPWAVGPPAYVNPSYASPSELAALAQLPGEAQSFAALAAGTRALVGRGPGVGRVTAGLGAAHQRSPGRRETTGERDGRSLRLRCRAHTHPLGWFMCCGRPQGCGRLVAGPGSGCSPRPCDRRARPATR